MDTSDERSEEELFSSCQSSWLTDATTTVSTPHLILKEAKAHLHLSRREAITTPIDCTTWDKDFEGRLLRVLNYRFYDRDLKFLFYNQKYVDGKTQSDPNDGEGVMQTIAYDEYVTDARPRAIEVIRPILAARQSSSIFDNKLKLCRQFYRFWRDVLTFKFCRRRRVVPPTRPAIE